MRVKRPIPSEKVAAFVQDILVIENCSITTPFCLPLFANGKPTLLFQTARGRIQNSVNYLTLFGQTVAPDMLVLEEDFTLVAYFFKPYALPALFGVKASELTDKPVDLHLLMPSVTTSLQDRLLHVSNAQDIINLIDDYVHQLVMKTKYDVAKLSYATSRLAANPSRGMLAAIQKELYITERSLQRLFEDNIGVSPNQYRRIAQFDAAFNQLNRRQFRQLSDIAFEHHYADQSHFIRAFKEFANLLPGQYLKFGARAGAT